MANNWANQHWQSNAGSYHWHPASSRTADQHGGTSSNFHNAQRRTSGKGAANIECHYCHKLNDKSADNCWHCNKSIAHSSKATSKASSSSSTKGKGRASQPTDPQVQKIIDEVPPATLLEVKSHPLWQQWGYTPVDSVMRNRRLDNLDAAIRIHAGVILAAANAPETDTTPKLVKVSILKGIKLSKKTEPQ